MTVIVMVPGVMRSVTGIGFSLESILGARADGNRISGRVC
jgi:hypothetical protein